MDLRANIEKDIILKPGERRIIKTGLFLEIPEGVSGRQGCAPADGSLRKLVLTPDNADAIELEAAAP